MNKRNANTLTLIVVAAAVAGALWFFRAELIPATDEIVVIQPADVEPEALVDSGPRYPLVPAEPAQDASEPAPPLTDEDFRQALLDVFGPDAGLVLVNDVLVTRFVGTVDNLPRSQVAEKIRVVGRLPGEFIVDDTAGEDGQLYLSPDNYMRYKPYVDLVAGVEPETIAATYRRFYPLFQQGYTEMGYPDGYFNDRVVEVIDQLLETPEPAEPVLLVRQKVLYQFADDELEALSSGQKLLIRMGGENAGKIKQVLRQLRALIAPPPDQT